MKRNILPNILSISRIVLSVALLAMAPATVDFYIVYFICGITDVLDGFLARRFDAVSESGKVLDLIGDIAFATVLLILVFRLFSIPLWIILWVVVIAVVRMAAWLTGYLRLRTVFTHTYLDRVAGIALFFLLPTTLLFPIEFTVTASVVCAVASLATLDLFAISLLAKRSRTGIYSVLQIRRAKESKERPRR